MTAHPLRMQATCLCNRSPNCLISQSGRLAERGSDGTQLPSQWKGSSFPVPSGRASPSVRGAPLDRRPAEGRELLARDSRAESPGAARFRPAPRRARRDGRSSGTRGPTRSAPRRSCGCPRARPSSGASGARPASSRASRASAASACPRCSAAPARRPRGTAKYGPSTSAPAPSSASGSDSKLISRNRSSTWKRVAFSQ